jgi:hypothetical protein
MKKQQRKANGGSFKPGPDPRRHTFTRAERQRGFKQAQESTMRDTGLHRWWLTRIRSYYRANK